MRYMTFIFLLSLLAPIALFADEMETGEYQQVFNGPGVLTGTNRDTPEKITVHCQLTVQRMDEDTMQAEVRLISETGKPVLEEQVNLTKAGFMDFGVDYIRFSLLREWATQTESHQFGFLYTAGADGSEVTHFARRFEQKNSGMSGENRIRWAKSHFSSEKEYSCRKLTRAALVHN